MPRTIIKKMEGKEMKKKLVILLMILMMICLTIVSYTGAASTKIKLIVAAHVTPNYHDLLPPAQSFIDDVNKIGVGKVELDFYHSSTLLGVNELVPGLESGTADIIFLTTSHTSEDMKGLTIRVGGENEARAVKSLGGSPVFMPSGEIYEALQRGTIDGVVCYAGTIGGRSLQEVVKYCTKVPIGAYGYSIFIKKSTYDSLPEDVRTLLYVAAVKYDYNHLEKVEAVEENEYWSKLFAEAGMEVIEPPKEVLAEFQEKCKPVWSEWANEIGAELGNQFIELATSK